MKLPMGFGSAEKMLAWQTITKVSRNHN